MKDLKYRRIIWVLPGLLFILNIESIASEDLKFSNISVRDGLSNLNITAITQDPLGYIWIGTMRGLNRYDGQNFDHFLFLPDDSASLYSNNIYSLYCRNDGLLFVGTNLGLCYYDSELGNTGRFYPEFKEFVVSITGYEDNVYVATQNQGVYRIAKGDENPVQVGKWSSDKYIKVIFIDNQGRLWCGLDNGDGLGVFNDSTGSFEFFLKQDSEDPIKSNSLKYIYQTSDDLLVLGTNMGVSFFDISKKEFVTPIEYQTFSNVLDGKQVNFIFEFTPNNFWFGTETDGVFLYNLVSDELNHYYLSEKVPYSIHSDSYMVHYVDKLGNIWLGSFDNGIDVHFKQAKSFNTVPELNLITRNEFITGIDRNIDNLIIATRKKGFFTYNLKNKTSKNYNPDNSALAYSYLRSVLVDSRNQYWIGTLYSLHKLDFEESGLKRLEIPEPINGIVTLHEANKMIFAGADKQGLLIYDLDGKKIYHSLEYGNNITKIIQLNDSEILFTSYGYGLYAMNIGNFSVRKIEIPKNLEHPGFNWIVTAYQDSSETLWLGTYNYGLLILDMKDMTVKNLSIGDGLPSSDVLAIEEDDRNNLWISTSFGLVRLNKVNLAIKTYSMNEGLNNYQFHEKASFRDESGMIYFGGNFGLTYFNPEEIESEINPSPKVILESLFVNNREIHPEPQGKILNRSLPFSGKITLTHIEKNFSLQFVAFDFFASENLKYSYMLEGFDKEWHEIGNLRRASFSNLKRGNYVFKVRAVNSEGIWSNSPVSLMIRIKPAPWFSAIAWTAYALIAISFTILLMHLFFKAALVNKKLELEQLNREREKELNQMKIRFFSNIAHEFRTPLTLIGGIIQRLEKQQKIPQDVKEFIQIAGLNISRLLKLVNQLLAFKMMENEALGLWIGKGNLNDSIQKILKTFKILALDKQIDIEFIEDNSYDFYFDEDKIEKILSNLLSNAIKYTDKGGYIEINLKKISKEKMIKSYISTQTQLPEFASDYIEITVADNGAGMDDNQLRNVFNRYQALAVGHKFSEDYSSIGIGLNFTKKLVELHKGFIKVKSQPDAGTEISFVLPFDNSLYEAQNYAETNLDETHLTVDNSSLESTRVAITADLNKVVIIAEDDPQLNSFLKNTLRQYYTVFSAFNGEEVLDLLKKKQPDIIISDIMMSRMNGLELTRYLKNSTEFSHIPLILLTSKTEVQDQIEGIKSGAEHYIAKPFNMDYLLSVVDSQLKNRERIQKIFLNGLMPKFEKSEGNPLDIKFLAKLNEILESELINPDLDISLIAKKMNMSRSSFYRKFINLTKLSPIAYIKKYRINKSVALMNSGVHNIQEISDQAGFGSSSYFSTAFKQEKNLTPTDYINELKRGGVSNRSDPVL